MDHLLLSVPELMVTRMLFVIWMVSAIGLSFDLGYFGFHAFGYFGVERSLRCSDPFGFGSSLFSKLLVSY